MMKYVLLTTGDRLFKRKVTQEELCNALQDDST
jgi:hypothetical protein